MTKQDLMHQLAEEATAEWRRRPGCEQVNVVLTDLGRDMMVQIEDPDFKLHFKIPMMGRYQKVDLANILVGFTKDILRLVAGEGLTQVAVACGADPNFSFEQDWIKRGGGVKH